MTEAHLSKDGSVKDQRRESLYAFAINPHEIWAATSLEEAISHACERHGVGREYVIDDLYRPHRLQDHETWSKCVSHGGSTKAIGWALLALNTGGEMRPVPLMMEGVL